MRLASVLTADGRRAAAIVEEDRVFVTQWPGLDQVIAAETPITAGSGQWQPRAATKFDVPIRPPVLLCTGNNYRDHNDERTDLDLARMEFFLKAGQTIGGLDEPLSLAAAGSAKVDQETELGIVIGHAGRDIPLDRALDHVFGYVIVNDVTARDRQVRRRADGFAMELGTSKNFDGATRLNHTVVTRDEISDPQGLIVETLVNGELRQCNSTANMIHSVAQVVSEFSKMIHLHAGLIISTGTPGGTGWGQDAELGGNGRVPPGCKPAAYLAAGDIVESRIAGLDPLRFSVAA